LVASLIGLKDVRATLAMMRTPDGYGIELGKFHTLKRSRAAGSHSGVSRDE
jgi:hypothetical protein